jgi:hypothetical protein
MPPVVKERVLEFGKKVVLEVLTAGEDGPRDMVSKVCEGMLVCARWRVGWRSMCRGRSVGGRGAGPGFINWLALYRLPIVNDCQ